MDPLSPRLAVPLSDAEIVSIYCLAKGREDSGRGSVEILTAKRLAQRRILLASAGLIATGLAVCLILVPAVPISDSFRPILVIALILMPVGFYSWLQSSGRFGFGLLGAMDELRHPAPSQKLATIDPEDPYVLATVVNHITDGPKVRAETMQQEISDRRDQVGGALSDLRGLVEGFDRKIQAVKAADLRLILESRRDAALRVVARWEQVDLQLSRQVRLAAEAIAPLLEIRSQFEWYRRLNRSLERIQVANDLALAGEEQVFDNRLELRSLYASSLLAQAQLAEIEMLLKSTEMARDEVRSLMS